MYKKIISLTLFLVLAISFSACSDQKEEAKKGDSMTLEEIFAEILKDVGDMPEVENIKIDDEIFQAFLFIEPIEGAEALASEGLMSSIAHSAVLLRLPEGEDVEKVRAEIEKNADPVKWICVGAEKVKVVAHGNTILLVMSFEDLTDKIADNFDSLWK